MDKEFPIKGRYVIAVFLFPILYLPGVDFVYGFIDEAAEWFWYEVTFYICYQIFVAVILIGLVYFYKIDWSQMLTSAGREEYPYAIKLTLFIFIFSMASGYALFYPLSFVVPEFVTNWIIDIPPLIYSYQQTFPVIPNILNFISLVVVGPIIEEFVFRGMLLHRWSGKWGMNRAILFSSFLFGILHPDLIGAFAFGLAMSVLYLRTKTLVVPMICHALNNLLVWLIEAGYIVALGSDYVYTLEDFQSDWAIGVACSLITILWAYTYLKGEKSQRVWGLPKI